MQDPSRTSSNVESQIFTVFWETSVLAKFLWLSMRTPRPWTQDLVATELLHRLEGDPICRTAWLAQELRSRESYLPVDVDRSTGRLLRVRPKEPGESKIQAELARGLPLLSATSADMDPQRPSCLSLLLSKAIARLSHAADRYSLCCLIHVVNFTTKIKW